MKATMGRGVQLTSAAVPDSSLTAIPAGRAAIVPARAAILAGRAYRGWTREGERMTLCGASPSAPRWRGSHCMRRSVFRPLTGRRWNGWCAMACAPHSPRSASRGGRMGRSSTGCAVPGRMPLAIPTWFSSRTISFAAWRRWSRSPAPTAFAAMVSSPTAVVGAGGCRNHRPPATPTRWRLCCLGTPARGPRRRRPSMLIWSPQKRALRALRGPDRLRWRADGAFPGRTYCTGCCP